MPRKACVTGNEIFDAVKDRDCLTDSGVDLKSRSDSIWADICRSLENRIQITNLYLYLKQNRNGVLSCIMDYKGIAMIQNVKNLLSFESSNMNMSKEDESIESIVHSDNESVCVKNGNECSTILYMLEWRLCRVESDWT